MSLKHLPLESWMKTHVEEFLAAKDEDVFKRYVLTKPVLNKNGIFLDTQKKMCWFECNGYAFLYSRESFEYAFERIQNRYLSSVEAEAIKVLLKYKTLDVVESNKLRRRLSIYREELYNRRSLCQMKKSLRAILAKYKISKSAV